MQKKSIKWLGASFATLLCFIIATMGFGFRYKFMNGYIDLPMMKELLNFTTYAFGGTYIKDSYALMVAGFTFATLAICLSIFAICLNTKRVKFQTLALKEKWVLKTWQLIKLALFMSFVMVFSGELVFAIKEFEQFKKSSAPGESYVLTFGEFWKVSTFVGMLIFTLLPLITLTFPTATQNKPLKAVQNQTVNVLKGTE